MRVTHRRIGWSGIVACLAFWVVPGAAAQDSTAITNHLYDKLQVNVNFTTVLNNSTARVDASDGDAGTQLDFKKILGISSNSVQPALGLAWKPGRRTEFDLGYQFINQSGSRTLADTIYVGDDTLAGGLRADTKVGSSNATFQFKYALFASPKHTIGLAIGFGAIFLSLDIDAAMPGCVGSACDSTAVSVRKQFTGPTVALGAYGNWRLSERWYVGADARAIGAKIDRFDFSVFEGNAGAGYFLSNRWGVLAAVYYTDVSVDVAAKSETALNDFIGKLSYNYSSFRLGVIAAF